MPVPLFASAASVSGTTGLKTNPGRLLRVRINADLKTTVKPRRCLLERNRMGTQFQGISHVQLTRRNFLAFKANYLTRSALEVRPVTGLPFNREMGTCYPGAKELQQLIFTAANGNRVGPQFQILLLNELLARLLKFA